MATDYKSVTFDPSAGWQDVTELGSLSSGQRLTIIPLHTSSQSEGGETASPTVPSNSYGGGNGIDTGVSVWAGQVVTITATGSWDDNVNQAPGSVGPDGRTQTAGSNWRLPGVPTVSLIGRIGTSGSWFLVGSSYSSTASKSGQLYLSMNDQGPASWWTDNGGQMSTQITTGLVATTCNLKARIGGGSSFDVGTQYDQIIGSSGTLSLSSDTCSVGSVTALVIVDAPGAPPDVDCPVGHGVEPASANPVKLRTGDKVLSETDLGMQTPAGTLSFTRNYTQSKQTDDDYKFMGLGWSHNHATKLSLSGSSPNRTATIALPEGGTLTLDEDSNNAGHFDAQSGSTSVLDHNATDSEYVLTAEDKSAYAFDDTSGELKSRAWPSGETWTYIYTNGQLSEVDDGYGRKLQFAYSDFGQFADVKLWRVGDHDVADLENVSAGDRYVEFGYVKEKSDGQPVQNANALLSSVRDVLGETWTYDYYGQASGETDADLLNFMTERSSPSVDTTGDGTKDGSLSLESLSYTISGGTITDINQERGGGLIETDFAFQPEGDNLTAETTAGKKTIHHFANGVYVGAVNPADELAPRVIGDDYRPLAQYDGNSNETRLNWSSGGKHLIKVTDALPNDTTFAYDAEDRLVASTDAELRVTRYIYTSADAPRQPTRVFVTDGSDLAVNGGMEADSDWTSVGTPTTNARVSTEVDTGTYSRHVVTDAADEGIEGADFDLVSDRPYVIAARVYVKSGVGNATVMMKVSGTTDFDTLSAGTDEWETLYVTHTPTSGSSDVNLQFLADGGTAEFFVDSVAILEGTAILRWEDFTYDTSGRVTSEKTIDPADGATEQREVSRTYYTELSIGTGAGEDYGAGMLKTVTQKDPEGVESDVITTYFYDAAGRILQTNQSTTFGGCSKAYTVYDDAGDVLAEICNYENTGDPPTTAQEAADLYDPDKPDENHVTTHAYDELGRRVQTTTMAGSDEEVVTLTAYDALDRVIRTIRNYVSDVSITHPYTAAHSAFDHGDGNNENLVTDTAYNARGLVVSQTDIDGNVTLFGYDDADRQVKVVQNASNPTYDASYATGDPDLSAYTPSGNADEDILTEQVYDAAGNLLKAIDPVGNVTLTVYDALNRPVKGVRAAKDSATLDLNPGESGYDAANDPRSDDYYVASTDPDRDRIDTTEYDAMGRVIRTTDPLDNVTLHGYDVQGRSVKVVRSASEGDYDISSDPDLSAYSALSNADEDLITETAYDAAGRVQHTIDLSGAQTRQAYDGFGRVIRAVTNYDVAGAGLTNEDPADWIWDATDARWEDGAENAIPHGAGNDRNVITATAYDDDGRVLHTRDALGRQTWYVYDALGRRVKTIQNCTYTSGSPAPEDADYVGSANSDEDVITHVIYDPFGRVAANVDARGNTTVFNYDVLGRRTETVLNYSDGVYRDTHPDLDLATTTTFDLAGRVTATVNPAGVETRFAYDGLGRQISVVRNYVSGSFDPAHPDQDVVTQTEYDKAGRVTATIDARGTRTEFGYDAAGRRRTVTQAARTPLEAVEWTVYDKASRVERTIANCTYEAGVDPYSPDEKDDLDVWLFDPETHGRFADQNLVTEFTLDIVGRVTSVTDPVGNATGTVYNADGTVQSTTDPTGVVTRFVYDELLRQTMVVQAYYDDGIIDDDPANWVWDDQLSLWKDGSGNNIPHDSDGTDNHRNIIALVELDATGRRTKLTDPRGNETDYAYDALDRRTSLTDPLSNQWSTAFADLSGGAGTRQTLTDPKTDDTRRDFDRLGRPVSIEYLGESPKQTPDVTFDYDAAGNQSRMSEWDGSTLVREAVYHYDDLGRLAGVDFDTDGDGTAEQSVEYAYDAGGLRTRLVLPDGKTVLYGYDERGQLTGLSDWDFNGTAYAYDRVGRLIEADRSSGFRSRYAYDEGGRLRLLQHIAGARTLGHFAYDMDALGNRTQVLEAVPHPATTTDTVITSADDAVDYYKGTWSTSGDFEQSTDFSASLRIAFFGDDATLTLGTGPDHGMADAYLNGVFWRTLDSYAATSGEQTIPLAMDGDGPHVLELQNRAEGHPSSTGHKIRFKQLVVADRTYDLHTIQYQYDALSRLTDADYLPGFNTDATAFRAYDYSYDLAGNRTQKVVTVSGSPTTTNYTYNTANQLTSDGTNTFTYDANGNLTSDGVNTYTWDRANRLLSIGSIDYAYDGAGRRVSCEQSGVVTEYLLNVQPELWTVLAETTNGATTHYLYGPMGIHGHQNNAGDWGWMVQDALGSVRAEADANLGMLAARQFAPYGDPFEMQGSFATPFAFTGEPADSNGLLHLRARYYSPLTGRFFQIDPSGQEQNWYQYSASNPVNHIDPSGMLFWNNPGRRSRLENPRLYEENYLAHATIEYWMEDQNGQWHTHLEFPGPGGPVAGRQMIDVLVFDRLAGSDRSPIYFAEGDVATGSIFEIEPASDPVRIIEGIRELTDRLASLENLDSSAIPHSGAVNDDRWPLTRPTQAVPPLPTRKGQYKYNLSSTMSWIRGRKLSNRVELGPVRVSPSTLIGVNTVHAWWIMLVAPGLILYEREDKLVDIGIRLIREAIRKYLDEAYRRAREEMPDPPRKPDPQRPIPEYCPPNLQFVTGDVLTTDGSILHDLPLSSWGQVN